MGRGEQADQERSILRLSQRAIEAGCRRMPMCRAARTSRRSVIGDQGPRARPVAPGRPSARSPRRRSSAARRASSARVRGRCPSLEADHQANWTSGADRDRSSRRRAALPIRRSSAVAICPIRVKGIVAAASTTVAALAPPSRESRAGSPIASVGRRAEQPERQREERGEVAELDQRGFPAGHHPRRSTARPRGGRRPRPSSPG